MKPHRFSYEYFNGPIPVGMVVCHKCDNPACVNPSHLFSGTQKENIHDAHRKGRTAKGSTHGRAKLTDSDVLAIREQYRPRYGSLTELGKEFGITNTMVNDIVKRKNWKHI